MPGVISSSSHESTRSEETRGTSSASAVGVDTGDGVNSGVDVEGEAPRVVEGVG